MPEPMIRPDDEALRALFFAPPIEDAGFSHRVVARLRRQLWVRRLAVPLAALLGLAIAFRPALQLIEALPQQFAALSAGLTDAAPSQYASWMVASLVITMATFATLIFVGVED